MALTLLNWPARYARWLHLQWPGGQVEKLPEADDDGSTNVPGLRIVGDLTGIPLLKLSANAGHDAVVEIAGELDGEDQRDGVLDLAIIGGGTAGFSAAKEADRRGLRYCVFEANTPFNTIKDFPKGKHIYTYPTDVEVKGELDFHDKSDVKEGLVEDLNEQTVDAGLRWVRGRVERIERKGDSLELALAEKAEAPEGVHLNGTSFVVDGERVRAKRVIVAIGRSGNYRSLGVPGEDKSDKVGHRLHDPADYCDKKVLVVGGGDSAMETAIALTKCGADVTLSYRKKEFSRPKPDNQEAITRLADNPDAQADVSATDSRQATGHGDWAKDGDAKGKLTLLMPSNVKEIKDDTVVIDADGETKTIDNDHVFLMIGREAPLDFFRRSGVKIRNERTGAFWLTLAAFVLFCVFLYHWKKGGVVVTGIAAVDHYLDIGSAWAALGWFPYGLGAWLQSVWSNPANPLGTLAISLGQPGFYYTLAYCACVVGFGIDRVRRKPTPYIKTQTTVLALFQVIPLFVLPYFLLPWVGHAGGFDGGVGRWFADTFFPASNYGHGREYWRAFGFVLAWPLFIWNLFTERPMWGWLIVSFLQTFVLIPAAIYYFGKGVYCGWVCSCGALAETLGDRHRHKMPHGAFWNRVNFVGQAFLVFAFVLLGLRILAWSGVGWAAAAFKFGLSDLPLLNYVWFVDLLWAGILGVGLYFWFSGRVWCRFACPLAALMHVYHRFGRFAILADKKKCISCNVCTSVCHQGIDVMSFANKGRPMVDPQCVRCSACVQQCPTGVLEFGTINREGNPLGRDPAWLAASPVRLREGRVTPNDAGRPQTATDARPTPAVARVGLTVNGRRVRKSTAPSPLSALLARAGVRG